MIPFMLLPILSYAETCTVCDNIKQHISQILPSTSVTSVQESQINGVYEVVMGNNIMYTDKNANLFMAGHIFNPKTNTDLTAQRLSQIKRISFDSLPLHDAIVSGKKGGKKVAIFTDPDCPYCRKLEGMLKNIHDIEVYTFLFPLTSLHPDSAHKAQNIWCAKNRHKALIDTMLYHQSLPDKTCENPIRRNLSLAKKLGIQGTPTLISESGKVMNGMPRTQSALLEWMK